MRWGSFALMAALWGCAFALAATRGGYSAWLLVYSVGALLLYAIGVPLLSLRGLRAERSMSQFCALAGGDVQVTLRLVQRSWLPLVWLVVREEWRADGRTDGVRFSRVLFPWFRRRLTCTYTMKRLSRGVYRAQPVEAVTGDLFGLIHKRRRAAAEETLTVYPRPYDVRRWRVRGDRDEEGRIVLFPPAGDARLSGTVRDYAEGDPPRRIHWKATARSGELKTREEETSPSESLMVYLDAAAERGAGAKRTELFESAVQLAAGLLRYAAEARSAAGIVCRTGSREVSAQLRAENLAWGYAQLAALEPAAGRGDFADVVRRHARTLPPSFTVVCVTSALNEGLLAAAQELRAKRRRVQVLYVHAHAALPNDVRQWCGRFESAGCAFTPVTCLRGGMEVNAYAADGA
ncbi:DUF58 domain-containing protein [Paenibacillus sp. MBLB4367]|uniref:DUF58 domain-containing protein n=1 Tax=Paenibacillus sp. MBLB4367 TaxID=3384767 RepID=UPI0039081BC6